MELMLDILPILLLLLLSAFFSGSETAMTAASLPRMLELERQGNAGAATVVKLRNDKERLIGTLLLGNNLVNILASALATSLFLQLFAANGVIYATIVMTVLVLVFAEVLPKTYAFNYSDRMALAVAPIIRYLVVIFSPVSHAVQVIVTATLRLFGVRADADAVGDVEEELRGVISLHQGPEPEVADEREMLRSVLDLADLEVEEIMTHRSALVMVDAQKSPQVVVRQVLASPHTRLPVFEGNPDNIVGVIHAKDLLRAVHRTKGNIEKLDIKKVASTPWFIPESTSLIDQLREFRRRREHFAIVVDEYGDLQGVVTLEDILEEIVGDIADEHDQMIAGIRPTGDGAFVVDGDVTIRDLNRELGWDLPDQEASTVAGLVMYEAQRIPEVKQVFAFYGFRFEILRRKNNRITSIRVRPLEGARLKKEASDASDGSTDAK